MNREQLVHSINQERRNELRPRAELIEEWRTAPERLRGYPAGVYKTSDGSVLYNYTQGTRLWILDQEVMDTCQLPWAHSTADRAFATLGDKENVRVLERGFGMGLVATRVVVDHLGVRGGEYTCIELNEEDANYADNNWRRKQIEELQRRSRARTSSVRGLKQGEVVDNVIINDVIRGDSFEETAKLAEQGRKFDIIISDTYPLSREERSVNDLLDLNQLVKCLEPDGVFAFFGYHTGSDGTMNAIQRSMIDRYFRNVNTTHVNVNPPPEYKYFNPPSGPVRRLPVIICTQPQQFTSC